MTFSAPVAVDTHAIAWFLLSDPRLSTKALILLRAATNAGDHIYVPSICLVELTYLIEKSRLPQSYRDRLVEALDDATTACILAPLNRDVAEALELVSRADVPDLPDRIVAATALSLGVPLISRDRKIRASSVETIW